MAENLESEIRQLYEDWIANPTAVVCARLADRLRVAGRNDEALEVARRGSSEWPVNTSIKVVAARCLRGAGDSQAAKEGFESVLSVDPLNLIALKNLAEIALEQGRYDDTVRLFGDYLFENPGDQEAEQQLDQAKKLQRQALSTPPPASQVASESAPAAAKAAPAAPMRDEHEAPPVINPQEPAPASMEELFALKPEEPSAVRVEDTPSEEPVKLPDQSPAAFEPPTVSEPAGPGMERPDGELPASFPQTARMDKILRDQGLPPPLIEDDAAPAAEPNAETAPVPEPVLEQTQQPSVVQEPSQAVPPKPLNEVSAQVPADTRTEHEAPPAVTRMEHEAPPAETRTEPVSTPAVTRIEPAASPAVTRMEPAAPHADTRTEHAAPLAESRTEPVSTHAETRKEPVSAPAESRKEPVAAAADVKPQPAGLKREPRSLFDLFSPEERAELFLEPYKQEQK